MTPTEPDWAQWLRRWDAQQEGYVPEREERFNVMFDVLAELLASDFTAIDLGCGPGSLSARLLARFTEAHVIAVDMDPAMLALGQGALGDHEGRLRWVEADLASPGWVDAVGAERVDAVLSSTALHWVEPEPLARVYRELGGMLPLGGVLLNADHLHYSADLPTFERLSEWRLSHEWTDASFAARHLETSEQWWAAFSDEPALAETLDARERLFATKTRPENPPDYDFHLEALRAAGFREVGTVWQVHSDRVVLAIR